MDAQNNSMYHSTHIATQKFSCMVVEKAVFRMGAGLRSRMLDGMLGAGADSGGGKWAKYVFTGEIS